MRYCEDGTAFNYKDPILSKECKCDEIVTHYDSRYSKYAKKDENPKSEAPTDTSSIYQGSNDSKGTSSEKHLDTQDSAIKPQGSRIEPQDSKIESQYTAIEETQESTTEPHESTTTISYDDYDEIDEKNYPDSTIEPLESTNEPQESTTEYQDLTELQPVLQEGPIAMNKNYNKIIDPIVKAVLKKLELKHTAIEESKESTTEPQSTTESQKSTTEPQESTSEPQDPTELEPVLTQGPILMNKNENNIIKRIVKAVMKTVEWKNVMIEEQQDPTELQPVAAAVLKKLELHHTGV